MPTKFQKIKTLRPIGLSQKVILLILLALGFSKASGQVVEYNMFPATVNECDGILYDSGGEDGIYGINENIIFTINSPGIIDILFFDAFCLENNFDFLNIFDGPNIASPLLGSYTGTNLPPPLIAASGSITFQLISDQSASYCGFSVEWNSTVPPPIPPTIGTDPLPICGGNVLPLFFSTPLDCEWLELASIDISSNSGIIIEDVLPICNNGISSSVDLLLSAPFEYNCNYIITMEIGIPDACDSIHEFIISHEFVYDNCPINAEVLADETSICIGGNTNIWVETFGCLIYTFNWDNGLPSNAGPHEVSPLMTTTYNVTITELETGLQSTVSITIEVVDLEIITPPQDWCLTGGILVLQANNPGLWSGNGITNDIAGTFDPTLAFAGLNMIYIQSGSCIDSVEINVIPINAGGTIAACPGSLPFQLIGFPAGGAWFGPFTTVEGIFSPNVNGSFPVVYSLGSCIDVLIVNVDNIESTFALDSVCSSEEDFQIDFSPIGGVWSGPGIVDAANGIFSPGEAPSGDILLQYSIYGCSQDFNIFVKEIEIGGNYHSACPDEEPLVWYNGNPTPPGGIWSGDGIIDTSSGLFDPGLFANNSSTSIQYDAPNGCTDIMYIAIVATFIDISTISFCIDYDSFLLNEETVGNGPGQNGVWLGPGITTDVDSNWYFDPSLAGSGNHVIYYEKNNCIDSILVNVYSPNIIESEYFTCETNDLFEIESSIENLGVWVGAGISNPLSGLFDATLSGPGDFTVYWIVLPACEDSTIVHVEGFQEATITGLQNQYCYSEAPINFTVDPASGVFGGDLNQNTFISSELGAGSFYVTFSVIGALCSSTDSIGFDVLEPLNIIVLLEDTILCSGQSLIGNASSTGGSPDSTFLYTWIPLNANGTYLNEIPSGSLELTVSVYDNCSNTSSFSLDIIVLEPIQISAITSDTVCFGGEGFIEVEALGSGPFTYIWDNGEITGPNILAPAGTAHSVVASESLNGCYNDTLILIPAFTPVQASFSVNPNLNCIPFNQAENIAFIDFSSFGTSGTWDFGNGTTQEYVFGENVNSSYSESGYYDVSLVIFNEGNCTDTAYTQICILADTPIFIPDIFSPNADGNNDMLFVRSQGIISMEFQVYNFWGENVFQTDNIERGWDGYHRGQDAPEGVYAYTLVAILNDGSIAELTGEITLVR